MRVDNLHTAGSGWIFQEKCTLYIGKMSLCSVSPGSMAHAGSAQDVMKQTDPSMNTISPPKIGDVIESVSIMYFSKISCFHLQKAEGL